MKERKIFRFFANHFLAASNEELGKDVIGFEDEVMSVFKNYNWPGNLREMRNVVKRATLLCLGDFISLKRYSGLNWQLWILSLKSKIWL